MIKIADNTLYTISAASHNNCRIKDTLLVKKKVYCGALYFPTAFLPDNNCINDIYKPGAVGILESYQLSIFNRYGQIVFTTNNITVGCECRSRNAEKETGSFILIK